MLQNLQTTNCDLLIGSELSWPQAPIIRRILRSRHLIIFPSTARVPIVVAIMVSLGNSVLLFRRLAPRLSKELFTCRQCLVRTQNYGTRTTPRTPSVPFARNTGSINAASLKSKARKAFARCASDSAAVNGAKPETSKSSFPGVSDKTVAYWLLGSAVSVFGIVVFGGLTRLTESGYVRILYTVWQDVSLADQDID